MRDFINEWRKRNRQTSRVITTTGSWAIDLFCGRVMYPKKFTRDSDVRRDYSADREEVGFLDTVTSSIFGRDGRYILGRIRASSCGSKIYGCHKALKTVTVTSPDVAVLFAPYIRRRRPLSVYHIVAQKRTKVTMKRAISLGRVESFPRR